MSLHKSGCPYVLAVVGGTPYHCNREVGISGYCNQHIPDAVYPMDRTLTINGVKFSPEALADILLMVTNPNPNRWYRFEREGDTITVITKEDRD